ncbi:G-type lectin S-receptor-like serine/threonine-protein kinase At4g27290 isoform X11 [Quercus robur]|uniref:G-type lectin S-receptor-like serine/threonine-protein kinase At4g27290 isoform X11 n=1 Tax=Quercus robur TaxID=38942 RepID=UPI002162BB39|nr:G-type lectin S-receptor-like serine/threonine-protein kinase At4g27290 isoform X11 [Quercus robur]
MDLLSSILVVTNLLFFWFSISYGVLDSITPSQRLSDGDTIVSREGNFVLGFFSPGSSKNRYLGIWYKSIPVQTVVWVANRVRPINDTSGILMINSTGNLNVIQNNSVVWSASTLKEAQSPLLQLLDTGNLVVTDGNSEDYLWQSFDYPSDTILPGMKFGWDLKRGLNRRLIAWKNWDDPSPVNFIFEVTLHNYPEAYLRRGSTIYFRSGPWNGYGFSGSPGLKPNPVFAFKFVFNQDEAYFIFTLKLSLYSRALPNQTNSMFQRFTWTEQSWQLFISLPIDFCDTYALCGANARCLITDVPFCQCLKGFKPKSQQRWDSLDWSQGCVRNKRLSCKEKSTHGFLKFSGLKLPDTTHSWLNTKMNLEECREECLNNCTCMAYTNSDIREGTGCAIWFGDLVDIKQFPAGGQDLYIRMHPSELGERKKEDVDVPLFDFTTVATATNKFSPANVIGAGGFGPVYKGHLCNGQDIAVKRLSKNSRQGLEEFKNEVVLIAKLQHKNLVKLLGYCVQGEEKMLIYEYMPNKSLDCFIFEQNDTLLAWPKRFDIIIGIVRGLLYLHQDSRLQVIHRDLKASNILLDINLNPKISDFGLARTFVGDESEVKTDRVVGTYGYMSPEYAVDGRFSVKSDVFSMGVLMLEIVSAMKIRKFFHPNHHHNLLGHAWLLWKEGKALELSYTCLEDSHSRSQILRCIQVGLLCVQNFPEDRPIMSCVNSMLTNEEAILPQPKQPGFFIEISPSNSGAILRNEESNIENAVTITMPEAR